MSGRERVAAARGGATLARVLGVGDSVALIVGIMVLAVIPASAVFPSSRSVESPDGEEEERRLFYVAITRARNELYLSYPLIRVVQGYAGDAMQQPSRFLREFPAELVDEWNLKPFGTYG